MIKVLVWGATDTVGGVEAVIWNYVSHMPKDEIKFDFINTYAHISIEEKVKTLGSSIICLPNRKKNYLGYKKRLNSYMREHASEYSVVWLNDCMFGNIDILKLAKKYGIKKRIIHAHNALNMGGGTSRLIRHKTNSWLLRKYVTDYWACSELAGKWSYPKDIVNSDKIRIIHNAIDVEQFSVRPEVRDCYRESMGLNDKLVFGHVGRFHYQKNHMFLIDIFYQIHRKIPDSVLILVGSGEDEAKVRKYVEEYELSDAVMFLGVRNDVAFLYQVMDAFLLPSLFEGLPVVMVEAQASGLPCFVSDSITTEADISGNVLFLSLKESSVEWAKKILNYMEQYKRVDVKETIVQNGYSIETEAMKLMNVFNGV